MKNTTRRQFLAATASAFGLALAACSPADDSGSGEAEDTKIIVGASPAPHAEILAFVADDIAEAGFELEVVEYSDYVLPNVGLTEGDLDANYFQHLPYLEDYNAENGTDIVSAAGIHFEPMAVYSNTYESLADAPDGAKIAVPSDATNEARALQLLVAQGLFTLKEGVGLAATANDIVDNPKNIEIFETEAANIPRALEDVDFGVVNGNYALSAGLDASRIIAAESADSEAAQTFANIIAVRAGDEDTPKTKALVAALTSDKCRDFITENYNGLVVATF